MAAGDAVQKGTTYLIGFGSLAYSGYMPEDGIESSFEADETVIKDERGAADMVLLQDPRKTFRGSFLILSTGSLTPPIVGATVTVTPPEGTSTSYRCRSASVSSARGVARLTLDLVKEDSMTYS